MQAKNQGLEKALYFGGAGDPSQGIAHANQVLNHEATRLLFLNFLLLWEAENHARG